MSFNKGKKAVFVIVSALVIASLLTGLIMLLWNWLMPDLFGLTDITYGQALGVLVLSKLLFGGWMHKKHCSDCHHSSSKWGSISPDMKQSLKEKFMQKWSQCHFEKPKSSEQAEDSKDNNPG